MPKKEEPQIVIVEAPPAFNIHPPLDFSVLEQNVQEILGIIEVFNFFKEDANKYLTPNFDKIFNKVCIKTTTSLRCPEIIKPLDITPPLEPTYEAGSLIGTLGVVLKFEFKKESASNFLKIQKEDQMRLFEVTIHTATSLECPEEDKIPVIPSPGPKLPDNAQYIQVQNEECFNQQPDISQNVDKNDSKWDWMKSGEKSAGQAKHRLYMFW